MELYIIAGPNGVGKTTFAREFLPNYAGCENFVNADLIAQALAPFSPETPAVRAGRMMLQEMQALAERRETFAFETTLSGRGYIDWLTKMKKQGYGINVFYLWVKSADLAVSRVRDRVLRGGHDIPEVVIRRRFDRSPRNFLGEYRRIADRWSLFDNSGESPVLVASSNNQEVRVVNPRLYNEFEQCSSRP